MGLQSDAKMERRNAHYSRRSLSTASIILQESLQSGPEEEEEEACNSRKDCCKLVTGVDRSCKRRFHLHRIQSL